MPQLPSFHDCLGTGEVQLVDPGPLDHEDWAAHQRWLTAEHRGWTFTWMAAR